MRRETARFAGRGAGNASRGRAFAVRGRASAVALALLAVAGGPVDPSPADAPRVAAVVSVGGVDAIPLGPSVAARLEEIRRRIQEAVVYPPLARRRRLAGVARVEFQVDPEGFARDVRLARSSGYGLLDEAAQQGVARARALPWVVGRLEVPVRFELR